MTRMMANNVRSFLYGFSGAGLFRRLVYPGAPNEFVDSRSLQEISRTGEIERNIRLYRDKKLSKLEVEAKERAAEKAAGQQVRR